MFDKGFEEIGSAKQARKLIKAIKKMIKRPPVDGDALGNLIVAFQKVTSQEAQAELVEAGIPVLLEAIDVPIAKTDESQPAPLVSPALVAFKIFGLYDSPNGLIAMVKKIGEGIDPDSFFWETIFLAINLDSPNAKMMAFAYRESVDLPGGFCAVAMLDFFSSLTHHEIIPPEEHPFRRPEGLEKIEAWIRDHEQPSYGKSAIHSVAFLAETDRARLLEFADGHPDKMVQLEAAWVRARHGDGAGITAIKAALADPTLAETAEAYLAELGAAERPNTGGANTFDTAEQRLERWIAGPQEWGEAPTDLECVYQKKLVWPLSGDDKLDVCLHKFKVGDYQGLALSAPTCWSFRGTDLSQFTLEQQVKIFGGWFVFNFAASRGHEVREPTRQEDQKAIEIAKSQPGIVDAFPHSKIAIGENMAFYSLSCTAEDGSMPFMSFALYAISAGIKLWDFEKWTGHEADAVFYAIGEIFFEDGEICGSEA